MQLEKEFYPKILDMTLFMVTYWNIGYVTEDKSEYERLCTEYVGHHIIFQIESTCIIQKGLMAPKNFMK